MEACPDAEDSGVATGQRGSVSHVQGLCFISRPRCPRSVMDCKRHMDAPSGGHVQWVYDLIIVELDEFTFSTCVIDQSLGPSGI